LVSFLVGISLFKVDELVQIGQHVDENTAVQSSREEMLHCELDGVLWLEEIDHLADDVLEIEI
jgi:hypothetical protein